MKLKIDNKEIELKIDTNGNLFYIVENCLFLLTISNNNTPELIKISNTEKIKIPSSEEISQMDDILFSELFLKNYINVKEDFLPEDKYFNKVNRKKTMASDDDKETECDDYLAEFNFCGHQNILQDIFTENGFESLSFYDVIIAIKEKIPENKRDIVFNSYVVGDTQSYRFTIYDDGCIDLNIIGTEIRKFNTVINDAFEVSFIETKKILFTQ